MLSGAGVQRSGTPAESKHPYLTSHKGAVLLHKRPQHSLLLIPEHSPSRDGGQSESHRDAAAHSLHRLHFAQKWQDGTLQIAARFHGHRYSSLRRLNAIRPTLQPVEIRKEATDTPNGIARNRRGNLRRGLNLHRISTLQAREKLRL